ncbi:hypothetical protein NW767_008444 [Fusarium falciforme]|nr:hypothetical protein NW767_008444 [Fusarium falciforme]
MVPDPYIFSAPPTPRPKSYFPPFFSTHLPSEFSTFQRAFHRLPVPSTPQTQQSSPALTINAAYSSALRSTASQTRPKPVKTPAQSAKSHRARVLSKSIYIDHHFYSTFSPPQHHGSS